jgi:hypothetical protein
MTIVFVPSLKMRYAAVDGMDGISDAMLCKVGRVGLSSFLRMMEEIEGRRPRRTRNCELYKRK